MIFLLLILFQIKISEEDFSFIEENISKLLNAVQKVNENSKSYSPTSSNCSKSLRYSLPELKNPQRIRDVDKIIDKYLQDVDSWKIFKRIDEIVHVF